MNIFTRTSFIAVVAFAALFASGAYIGTTLPSLSKKLTADFVKTPISLDDYPKIKKRRIIRVVEKPIPTQIACKVSTSSKDTLEQNSEEKFVYENEKTMKTKTCEPAEAKAAKTPNLFKQ